MKGLVALFALTLFGLSVVFRDYVSEALSLARNPPRMDQSRAVFSIFDQVTTVPNLDLVLSLPQTEEETLLGILTEKVSEQIPRIKDCYTKVKARSPASTEAEINLRVQGKKGRVIDLEIKPSLELELQRCLRFYVKSIRFQGVSNRERRVRLPIVID